MILKLFRPVFFTIFIALALLSPGLNAQGVDSSAIQLRGQIEAFLSARAADYEKSYLNIREREIGGLENEPFAWREVFMLESKEEFENNLGYTTERKFYFNIYHYETELDRKYALKYWMEDFIEGKSIRPSRTVRSHPYYKPTLILINPQNIIICNYDCKYYEEENFEEWKDLLMESFGDKKTTMMIEIECEGPLNWTINAPDPKIRDLF